MNINQLKYFNAICEHKTISAAAEHLFVSQPTISNAIKELEDEFGIVLFKRQHTGAALTPAGDTLLSMSSDLLGRMSRIESIMTDMGKGRKILRLGVPPMIGSMILPQIYRDFVPKNSEISIEITEGGKSELSEKLKNNYLDMIFLSHNEPLENCFLAQKVGTLEIVCCVSNKNPLSRSAHITPDDLKNIPLVLFKNSFFQTDAIKKMFAEAGITPLVVMQTNQLSSLLTLISNNTATGFLFRPLAENSLEYTPVSLNKPLLADISLVRSKNTYCSEGMKKFEAYVEQAQLFK